MATATLKRRLARVEALLPGPACDVVTVYFGCRETREHVLPRKPPVPGQRPRDIRCLMVADPRPDLSGDAQDVREQLAAYVPRSWAKVILNAREVALDGWLPLSMWDVLPLRLASHRLHHLTPNCTCLTHLRFNGRLLPLPQPVVEQPRNPIRLDKGLDPPPPPPVTPDTMVKGASVATWRSLPPNTALALLGKDEAARLGITKEPSL